MKKSILQLFLLLFLLVFLLGILFFIWSTNSQNETKLTSNKQDPIALQKENVAGHLSIDFDDGWVSQYKNALPILEETGIESTFYIISKPVKMGWVNYMTPSQVQLIARLGHEIESHTVSHPHLADLDEIEVQRELETSKAYLERLIGKKITVLAYPYGSFDDEVISIAKKTDYQGGRSVYAGLNTATTSSYRLYSYSVMDDTSFDKVKKMIDEAIQKDRWLILTFHQVGSGFGPINHYDVTTEYFKKVIEYVRKTGIPVITASEGLKMLERK